MLRSPGTSAGVLDATFGSNGVVVTSIGTAGDAATDVTIDHHGKIVVIGLSLAAHTDGDRTYYSPDSPWPDITRTAASIRRLGRAGSSPKTWTQCPGDASRDRCQ